MRVQFNLFGLLLASSTAKADLTFNLTPGVTPLSHDMYDLHMIIFWICVVIGVLVFGVMLYSMIYHRKSKGYQAVQFHEHTWLELIWTIIPLVILIVMAIPATQILIRMNDTEKEDITIKITGYQWKWKYEYLNQEISFFSNGSTPQDQINGKAPKGPLYLRTVDHPMVVPIHKKIRFLMTSNDVIHSWAVPDLGVKRDALPGFINEAWARINRAGTYYGQCTELCGINHAYMPIVVIAMTEQDFQNWVAQQKGQAPKSQATTTTTTTPAPTTTKPSAPEKTPAPAASSAPNDMLSKSMERGEKVYLSTCAVCHQANGEGMPPTFPALKGSAIAKGPVDAHIHIVLEGKIGTSMQAFKEQLNDEDLAAVITYERNAWENKTNTIVQPSDIKAARAKPSATGAKP